MIVNKIRLKKGSTCARYGVIVVYVIAILSMNLCACGRFNVGDIVIKASLVAEDDVYSVIPGNFRIYDKPQYINLNSDNLQAHRFYYVGRDGKITNTQSSAGCFYAIRPILHLSGLRSSGLRIGDTFEFGEHEFVVVSETMAFCTTDIGTSSSTHWDAGIDAQSFVDYQFFYYINEMK